MRGIATGSDDAYLVSNTNSAESTFGIMDVNPTGFTLTQGSTLFNSSGNTYIYIAIRRGPMKTPTSGTEVFSPLARTGTGTNPTVVTTGNNPDLLMSFPRTTSPAAYGMVFFDKLRGVSKILQSANANAEATTTGTFCLQSFINIGFQAGSDFIEGYLNNGGSTYANYSLTRAPGFFDVVGYTGNGTSGRTVTHGLGIAPELIIVKSRSNFDDWFVYSQAIGATKALFLQTTSEATTSSFYWSNTEPTDSVFTVNYLAGPNSNTYTYIAYLFATAPGVSKVGSYTGTGTTLSIDCGFTNGARFVLIKRTDSTADWFVWDTARGIISGDDPYLLLNSTAAEVTNTDYIDPLSSGFQISSTAPAAINASGGSFIFLAIA
jgi:hypothetical protein